MNNSDPLVPYGLLVIAVVSGFVVVPFLRGKADLLTAWNTLLMGLICFAGLGSIEVKYVTELPWVQVQWFQPTAREVQWYMLATTVFIITLFVAYYFNMPAKRFAQRRMQKWPEITAPVTFFVLGCCLGIALLSMVVQHVTFIGPATFKLGSKATVFAGVFAFSLWHRNRLNLLWLFVFIGVMMIAAFYAMLVSPGRRLLLGVFFGPLLYLYWAQARYWRPSRIVVTMALGAFGLLTITLVYSTFRWYDLTEREHRSAKGVVQKLKDLQTKGNIYDMLLKNQLNYFSQSNAHFAMLTERYVAEGRLVPAPLNTLRYLASFPIPRKIWRGKPDVLGSIITRNVVGLPETNWGCGVAGQGAYEGGIMALMVYAVLIAFYMRFLDEPLKLQPGNPFLVSINAAALPHILAIPRGDISTMITESGECVVFAVVLGYATRAIFGTKQPVPSQMHWQSGTYPT